MTDSTERVSELERNIEEIQLDLHAARVAITILSSAICSMTGNRNTLVDGAIKGLESAPDNELDHPVPDGYHEKLKAKILALL
ncbi:hypothetical protein KFO32_15610 [Pantoea ananatis]|uniref:hypothetical protein n=1 Tax=Pantoea ananas TaxID=553 RepID=UPI001FF136ED|nr:hypothetical protein [Pantoea ananatis]MCK0554476.1 hypothetical protein [Pantoea ananatis]